jgi:Tol biopolymer transport system component
MFMWVIVGCGDVRDRADAGAPNDSVCDPTGTFDAPMHLTEFDTVDAPGPPRLTVDERELYFTDHIGAPDANLYRAQRSAVGQPFATPIVLTPVNSAASDDNPTVSSDGLTLFFESTRLSGQGGKLFVSNRASRVGEFGDASKVANVNSTAVIDNDFQPFVTADGQELWFVSNRAGGLGATDIYRAAWSGSSFANVAAITALSSNADDFLPTLSRDKLTIYISSSRQGGQGGLDIWTAHRSTISDGFSIPKLVPELNSGAADLVGWLSPDSCRLYFSSDVSGTFRIYIATRHPL